MFSVNAPGFFVFMAVLLLIWYRLPASKRWYAMLGAGIVFYLSLDIPGFFVLLASALVVWFCARQAGPKAPGNSQVWFGLGLAAALGPLLLLKYYAMMAGTINDLFGFRLWSGSLLQPLGLAYYSLQLTGYLLDVRRGDIEAEPRFARLFCYASFFLSITQGPFNRYHDLMPRLDATPDFDVSRLQYGAMRCAWGYFKKYAIAERAATVVDTAFSRPADMDISQLIFGVVVFAFQLYADFSGYTDIVLGAGEMLGLKLPENFRQPYFASTIGEFWERWHISLSSWLRDYIFEPLAWNGWFARLPVVGRFFTKPPVNISLLLTFLVSGFWHGAAWTYVVWGLLNGAYQVVSGLTRRWRKKTWKRLKVPAKSKAHHVFRVVFVFVFICIGYVFFRAESLGAALNYFACMGARVEFTVFSRYWELGISSRLDLLLLLAGIAALIVVDVLHERGWQIRKKILSSPLPVRWCIYECAIFAFLLMGRFLSEGSFLYARF